MHFTHPVSESQCQVFRIHYFTLNRDLKGPNDVHNAQKHQKTFMFHQRFKSSKTFWFWQPTLQTTPLIVWPQITESNWVGITRIVKEFQIRSHRLGFSHNAYMKLDVLRTSMSPKKLYESQTESVINKAAYPDTGLYITLMHPKDRRSKCKPILNVLN